MISSEGGDRQRFHWEQREKEFRGRVETDRAWRESGERQGYIKGGKRQGSHGRAEGGTAYSEGVCRETVFPGGEWRGAGLQLTRAGCTPLHLFCKCCSLTEYVGFTAEFLNGPLKRGGFPNHTSVYVVEIPWKLKRIRKMYRTQLFGRETGYKDE